ncbi:MAG: hypothetical protein U0V02_02495 [Anaerolineales bacterium]
MNLENEKWAAGLWSGIVWLFNFAAPNPDEMALRVSIWFLVILTVVATVIERRKNRP